MSSAEFEPKRPHTYILDRTATGISILVTTALK